MVSAAVGPRLLTRRRGQPLAVVALLGLAATFGVVVLVLLAVVDHGQRGHARVLQPEPGTAKTHIQVLDGPRPMGWLIPTSDLAGAKVGDVVEVDLRGSCRCAPYAHSNGTGMVVTLCLLLIAMFALVLRGHLRHRRANRAQAAAGSVLQPDAPCLAVSLRAAAVGSKRQVRLLVDVSDQAGRLLGHLDLGTVQSAFDPHQRWWLVGEPLPSQPVALVSAGRGQVVLPGSPLLAGPAQGAPWSAPVLEVLGWTPRPDPSAAPPAPALPSAGRVSMAEVPGSSDRTATDEVRQRIVTRNQKAAVRLLGVFVVGLVGVIAIESSGAPIWVGFLAWLALLVGLNVLVRRSRAAATAAGGPAAEQLAPWRREVALAMAVWGSRTNAGTPWRKALPAAAF